jgi:large conductance mechanosensitive channel
LLIGGVDFTNLSVVLKDTTANAPAVLFRYGAFIQTVVDFLIIAFAIFVAIKGINQLKRKEEASPAAPPKPSNEEVLLGEIRDLLRVRK